eukprot:PLAT6866.3.p2 GENE.PLAT6866.3~~PLAT6866.3.p2  ORF type:complete len:563 (-),score=263.29 PLAT6866.3:1996-3684(-)
MLALLSPPTGLTPAGATAWLLLFYIIYWLATEVVFVPYNAWAVELTSEEEERRSLFSFITVTNVLSLVIVAGGTSVLSAVVGADAMQSIVAVTSVVLLAVFMTLLLCRLPERKDVVRKRPMSLIPGIRVCAQNGPYVTYVIMSTCLSIINETTGLFSFLLQYAMKVNSGTYLGPLVIVYAIGNILGVVLTSRLTKRYGKVKAFRFSLLLSALWMPLSLAFSHNPLLFILPTLVLGLTLGGTNLLGGVFVADCVDYDELCTGRRREATYLSLASLPSTITSIAGRAFPLQVLAALGFVPKAAEQPPAVITGLVVMVSVVPTLACLTAYLAFRSYPLTSAVHKAVLEQLKVRAQGGVPVDPLTGEPVGKTDVDSCLDDASAHTELTDKSTGVGDSAAAAADSGDDRNADGTVQVETAILYFGVRDLRSILKRGRQTYLAVYVFRILAYAAYATATLLRGARYIATSQAAHVPRHVAEAKQRSAFLVFLLTTLFAISLLYELLRLRGVRSIMACSPSQLSDAITRMADSMPAGKRAPSDDSRFPLYLRLLLKHALLTAIVVLVWL